MTGPTIEIGPCTVAEMRESAGALFDAHWHEVAQMRDLLVPRPDWARYEELEAAGALLLLAARERDRMVGYSASLLSRLLHYADVTACANDALFVESAGQGIGGRLMARTESEARQRGAQLALWHAKQGSKLDRMLSREGSAYSVQDIVYGRRI